MKITKKRIKDAIETNEVLHYSDKSEWANLVRCVRRILYGLNERNGKWYDLDNKRVSKKYLIDLVLGNL